MGSAPQSRRVLLVVAVSLTAPVRAHASMADVVGIGDAIGQAGAVAASESGGAAAYYNPAGVAFAPHPTLRLGVDAIGSLLQVQGRRLPLTQPFGISVEMAAPVPLLGGARDKLGVGMTLRFLPDSLVDIHTPLAEDPFVPYYQNRHQRIIVMPAVALRPVPRLSLGVAANYFAELAGSVGSFEGADRNLQVDVEEEILGLARLHAGVRYDAERYSLALVYRQRFTLPFQTAVDTFVADSNLTVDVRARAFFTPETFVLAGAVRPSDALRLALDVAWLRWSRYVAPFARVDASIPLPQLDPDSGQPTLRARSDVKAPSTGDAVRAATAAVYNLGPEWRASAGYAFETSPFGVQRGRTNLIDAQKHIAGLGLRWQPALDGRFRLGVDVAGQLHWMPTRRSVKDPALLPDEDPASVSESLGRQTTNLGYPNIEGGGFVLAGMLGVSVEWLPEPQGAPQ